MEITLLQYFGQLEWNMEIRKLTDQDAPAWWQVRLESLEAEPFVFGKAVSEHCATPVETIATRFRDADDTTLYLGAFESGELVGMVTFMRETGEKECHKGRMYGVYVSAAHRGRGIGRALIATLLECAKSDASLEQILLSVASSQAAAISLYQSFGFVKYGTEPNALKIGSAYVDEDHMILPVCKPA